MVAVDILSVPLSASGNKCLLVIQDFTKWADAIPEPNQKAITITKAFAAMGYYIPQILHSDQGQNFESTVLKQTLGYRSLNPQPTICKGMV